MDIIKIGRIFVRWSHWWAGQSSRRQHPKDRLRTQLVYKGFVDREDLYQLIELVPEALHQFGRPPKDVMENPPTVDEALELLR